MSDRIPHGLAPTKIYTKNGAIYLPHYSRKDVWVGPCGNEYREAYLKTYAVPGTMMLWPRNWRPHD